MTPDYPFWFKQRQVTATPVGTGTFECSGPNLKPAVIGVRIRDDLRWEAFVKEKADGPDVAISPAPSADARDATDAAFELYRNYIVN